jgi:cysteine desulfurase/selenocysteine lyase
MSAAQPPHSFGEFPVDDASLSETPGRNLDMPFTPEAIAQLANSFFRSPSSGDPTGQVYPAASGPLSPVGLPVTTPGLPDLPAPSVVTTVAPHAPAKAPYGPPDAPPTTIPSVVPTPNIPAPSAPTSMQSPTRPFGATDLPQPGASVGQSKPFGAPEAPGQIAFANPTTSSVALVPPAHVAGYPIGVPDGATPGGALPQHTDNLYFLNESALASHNAAVGVPNHETSPSRGPAFEPAQPAATGLPVPDRSVSALRANEGEPHRLSDMASLVTPPTPAFPGNDAHDYAKPGVMGPTTHDSLYFLTSAGERAGAEPTPVDDSYAPQLVSLPEPSRGIFDPYRVKKDFPILQQQVHGKPLIWLDNAATTQKPQAVIDRLAHFYEYENSNIHRAAHALAARATDAYEAAREKARRFLKAPSVKDIIFVRGTTEGINLIAQAWGRRNVQKGDEIVVTWLEHHANIVPWQMLCAEVGARLRVAPVDDRGQIILDEYEKLLNPKTRIVSITQVSNALGTVTPVKEMTAMAHRHGACVLVDGAQSVSHMPIDVQAIDCDFFVFSGHKVFGPTGIGVVFGKKEVLQHMAPWQGGGNMIADVTFEKTIYQGAPERFEAGTGNIADAVGLGAAIDYVETIGMDVIARYEHDLLVYATEQMRRVPGLTMIGTAHEKASVLSFILAGHEPLDVGKALDREGIAVRAGHHCAQPILRRFGLEATVRPSLAFYNTCADVDALVATLLRIQGGEGRSL